MSVHVLCVATVIEFHLPAFAAYLQHHQSLKAAQATELEGLTWQTIEDGVSGTYLLSKDGKAQYVFKPLTEEHKTKDCKPSKRGIVVGDCAKKELAAFALDHDGFAHVPDTRIVHVALNKGGRVSCSGSVDSPLLEGSLQQFVPNIGNAENTSSSTFSEDDVQRLAILDMRLLNLDRHEGNVLVASSERTSTASSLVPIDHAYCLPDVRCLDDVWFCWSSWKHAESPLNEASCNYVNGLDILADANKLAALGVRPCEILSNIAGTVLLKRGAHHQVPLSTLASIVEPFSSRGKGKSVLQELAIRAAETLGDDSLFHEWNPSIAKSFVDVLSSNIDNYLTEGDNPIVNQDV